MTHFPPSILQEKRRKTLRTIGLVMSGLMVTLVLVIFGLIYRNESAHDEQRCPFVKRSERELAGAKVSEEARSCLPEVEEHRWLVARSGKPAYELARKRLPKDRFSSDRFAWKLSEDASHRVIITIEVDGKLSSEFREEDAAPR